MVPTKEPPRYVGHHDQRPRRLIRPFIKGGAPGMRVAGREGITSSR